VGNRVRGLCAVRCAGRSTAPLKASLVRMGGPC
jgi:hypothetical protein